MTGRGRSAPDYERLYIDGYDMSGYTIDTGEHGVDWETAKVKCLSDVGDGVLFRRPTVTFGPINGVFDNTPTSGIHVLANAAKGTRRNILLARGVDAVPAVGDDTFCIPAYQVAYKETSGNGVSSVTMTFEYDLLAALNYTQFYGALLHPYGSETAANTANTNHDNGAATTLGGWFMYHIRSITGAGTVTISVDDSADGAAWLALAGATSGAIATASAPISGFVQLATTATVRRYLRYQIAFSGATACTFVSAFMRQ